LLLLLWQGCIHRDLKLSNVMFDVSSGAIRIADPGLMEPFGSPAFCFSADAPHIDFCRADVSGTSDDPGTMSALSNPVLDVRQATLSALFGLVGPNMPQEVNWRYNTRYEYIEAVGSFDWAGFVNEAIGPVCPSTARLFSSILGPLEQAAVPSIAELLEHPLLAPLAAEAQAQFARQRGAFQVQHHAAYWGGQALQPLLNGLPTASSSSSSTELFTRQISALQDRYSAAVAQGVTLAAADGQCDLPAGVSFSGCEMALAATAALEGHSQCVWNHAHLQAAEAKVLRWQVSPNLQLHQQEQQQQVLSSVVGSACSTPADSPTAALQHTSAAAAGYSLAAAAAWAHPSALPAGALCCEELEARLLYGASSSSNSSSGSGSGSSSGSMLLPVATAAWASSSALPVGVLCCEQLEARLFDEASSMSPPAAAAACASHSALPAGALCLTDLEARLFGEANSSSSNSMLPPVAMAASASPPALPAGALRLAELEARLFNDANSSSSMPPPVATAACASPSALPVGALRHVELEAWLLYGASSSSSGSMSPITTTWPSPSALPVAALRLEDLEVQLLHGTSSSRRC
jgi:hypothetical protein